jgi:hypothetical protein
MQNKILKQFRILFFFIVIYWIYIIASWIRRIQVFVAILSLQVMYVMSAYNGGIIKVGV